MTQAITRVAFELPQKPVNDTWEWRGLCCLVRIHRYAGKILFTPTWQEPVWNGLEVYPVRTTVVQLVGSEPLKPHVEKVTAKKDLKPRKVAHLWIGETRFQIAPRVLGNTAVSCQYTAVSIGSSDLEIAVDSLFACEFDFELHDKTRVPPVDSCLSRATRLISRQSNSGCCAEPAPRAEALHASALATALPVCCEGRKAQYYQWHIW